VNDERLMFARILDRVGMGTSPEYLGGGTRCSNYDESLHGPGSSGTSTFRIKVVDGSVEVVSEGKWTKFGS
jgi:hypothetical protein